MSKQRPFRFGILAENARTAGELFSTAGRAEETGFATFLIRDHFIEEPFGHQLAPLAALATVAAMTKTLRVGSLVFDNDYRHPVMLAKEAATLDVLSGGRFELGLGAGFSRLEYEQAGLPYDPPAVRVDRFEEAVQVLKRLFAAEPCTFSGRHYTVTNLDRYPKPVQRPHPPIHIGAGGKRMLSIAAREADTIGILTASISGGELHSEDPSGRLAESIAQRIEWVRQAAGARFDQIELSIFSSVVIAAERQIAAEEFARARGWHGIKTEQVLEMPTVFIGSAGQIVEQMEERRERYGLTYHVFSDRDLETAAPIVARLAGR
ncbi:MAG: TIGR03621 family F420-dependent LLM class oxidoreductase [Dehalococcoidia bacterium]